MSAQRRPNPRPKLGLTFAGLGIGAWGVGGALLSGNGTWPPATLPLAVFATAFGGAFLAAAGVSFMRAPRPSLKRRTNLAVVALALVLFSLMLLGATLSLGENLEHPTTAGRWMGPTFLLLFSTVAVFALLRDVVLRFRDTVPRWEGHRWRFTPRWKDELACTSPEGELFLGMATSASEPRVHFPTDEVWARQAPAWAKDRRAELLAELEQWCMAYGIALTVDGRASVDASSWNG